MKIKLFALVLLACPSLVAAADLADRLPQGAGLTGYIDIATLRDSPALGTRMKSGGLGIGGDWGRLSGWAEQQLAGLGVSLSEDIDHLAFGTFPLADGASTDLVLLLGGRFDPGALMEKLAAQGDTKLKVGALSGWQANSGEAGSSIVSILDAQTLFLGSRAGFSRLAQQPARPSVGAGPSGLPAGASAWAKFQDAPGMLAGMGNPIVSALSSSITDVSLWMGAKEQVTVGALLQTADTESAATLSKQAQLGLGLLSMQAPGDLGALLKKLKFNTEGPLLTVQVTANEAELGSLFVD